MTVYATKAFSRFASKAGLEEAEYQCDVLYRGQKKALAEFLPLNTQNWITCGNALRLDWLSVCPPTGTGVKLHAEDLFHAPLDQAQIDFENDGGGRPISVAIPRIKETQESPTNKRMI